MLTVLLMAALAGAPQGPAWTPPADPDPSAILQEARADTRERRYEAALAKFLWFHHHAVEYDQGGAVRLSFALAYWRQLADRYPPAMDSLKRARDRALAAFRKHRDGDHRFHAFHDFVAINESLEEESLTVRTFVALDRDDPATAERVYHVAQEALIRANAYPLCVKYKRSEDLWYDTAQIYRTDKSREERARPDIPRTADRFFTNRVATLLALLVVNGRQPQAEFIAEKARLELDDPAFRAAVDSALRGVVPQPRP